MNRFARIVLTWFGVTVGIIFGGWGLLTLEERIARQKHVQSLGKANHPGTYERSAYGGRAS